MLFGLADRLSHSDAERILSIWPADREPDFQATFGEHWTITVQATGDLGTKMQTYFETAFSQGMTKALLIGSDCPLLDTADLETAFARLDDHEVVLGPTNDGGYYLIGARDPMPDLFSGMRWSTPDVWPATIGRLEAQDIRWSALDVRSDVDDIDDLRALRTALSPDAYPSEPWDQLRRCIDRLGF
jgi:rSAM/selenodomain-associated transferase 1